MKEHITKLLFVLIVLLIFPLVSAAPHSQFPVFSAPEGFSVDNNVVSVGDDAVYGVGYYSVNGNNWQSFSLEGAAYPGSADWLGGSVTASLPIFGYGEHYVLVYSCSNAGSWDCHGNDNNPAGFWQLLVINNEPDPGEMHYLVENGVGQAEIVISPNALNTVKIAADELQLFIDKMAGVELPIATVINESVPYQVYIGQSDYTDALGITADGCEHGGYKMVSGDGYLVLLGDDEVMNILGPHTGPPDWKSRDTLYAEWNALTGRHWSNDYIDYYHKRYNEDFDIVKGDSRGSLNAVYKFLYDQGVRWYYPGAIGEIVPTKESVDFSNVNVLTNPDFALRDYFFYSWAFFMASEDELKWQLTLGSNDVVEIISMSYAHGIYNVINNDETKAEHPEYYATWNGVLMNGEHPKPDLCSEELFEEHLYYLRTMFDTYDMYMINSAPSDGFTHASDDCNERETRERGEYGSLSDYVWEFVNNVAWEIHESHPGKKIICGAYGAYTLPPLNLTRDVAPNLVVRIAKARSGFYDEEYKEFYNNLTNWWLDILPSKELYTYDFYLQNKAGAVTQSVPYYFPHYISEDFKFLKGKSGGDGIEIATNYEYMNLDWDIFTANALNVYITSHMYWDADQDVDALLDEYYELYYGPVSQEMKTFIEYAEQHYAVALKDPTVLPTMREMLTDVRNKAGNTIYGERVDMLIGLINSNYEGEEILIDSCQTLESPTTTYKLTSDVTSEGTCFLIGTVGVTIDCQGHTITYATGGGADERAVYAAYNSNRNAITIKNCNIQNAGPPGNAIQTGRSNGVTIENTNVFGGGLFFSASANVNIINVSVSSPVQGITVHTTTNGSIKNSVFSSDSSFGLYIYNSPGFTVSDTTASSDTNFGSHILECPSVVFENNSFRSNTSFAWYFYHSPGHILTGNDARSRDSVGLRMYSGSDDFLIKQQTAIGGTFGVDLTGNNNRFEDCGEISGGTQDFRIAGGLTGNEFVNCPYE